MDEIQPEIQRRTVTVFDVEDMPAASSYKTISVVLLALVIVLVLMLILKTIF